MSLSPFDQMQKAVDIVNTSPHPDNKIAATVFNDDTTLSCTNYWPAPISQKIGTNARIGGSSGTVHAETACILAATYPTDGYSLCVTDPFCPNCAKNMAEAGIKTIYIDHKGFDKDFVARRGDDFASMSMQICDKAGISVYELHRKERRLEPILEIAPDYQPPEDNPVIIEAQTQNDDNAFRDMIATLQDSLKGMKYAAAFAKNPQDQVVTMVARNHPVLGYTMENNLSDIEQPQGKYSFIQEPINRLLMTAARQGLSFIDDLIYCTEVPTAREQVNLVGAGITTIHVGDQNKARDDSALQAMTQLQEAGILTLKII